MCSAPQARRFLGLLRKMERSLYFFFLVSYFIIFLSRPCRCTASQGSGRVRKITKIIKKLAAPHSVGPKVFGDRKKKINNHPIKEVLLKHFFVKSYY